MNELYNPNEEHDACGVGFTAQLDGLPRRRVVTSALRAMAGLAHRGGGAGGSGDGAGLLLPVPWDFFRRLWPGLTRAANRPEGARPALGQFFLPNEAGLRAHLLDIARKNLSAQGFAVIEEREVPNRPEALGHAARQSLPFMMQLLLLPQYPGRDDPAPEADEECERRLYIARRRMENETRLALGKAGKTLRSFHVASLSCRSVVYKGMLPGAKLAEFYPDLAHELFTAPFAVFHERFSTNTLPSWPLAQPFRRLAHNGEINTIRGNVLHMRARESVLASPLFGAHMGDLLPIVDELGSDSAMFDNVLELLTLSGRSLPHALMMMVPEPFGRAYVMADNKRAFYEYHAALMEPWDGPTAMVFTDGRTQVGAFGDRNGLRPCRWSVDQGGLMVLASESGVEDGEQPIRQRGRLQPRRMIIADMLRRRIVPDVEIKGRVIRARPYRRALRAHCVEPAALPRPQAGSLPDGILKGEAPKTDAARAILFGHSERGFKDILLPMARDAQEPVQATGFDRPPAVLDERPQLLFDYFKQQFAQITNPPIDPQREELSMSLMGFAGRERNILMPEAGHCALLKLQHPFLTRDDLARLRAAHHPEIRCRTLDATFPVTPDTTPDTTAGAALESALDDVCLQAERAIAEGASLLIVSDAAAGPDRAPMPGLAAAAGLHHHLLRKGLRHACGILVESGEAFEIMHMALFVAYGASGVCPYAALDIIAERTGEIGKEPHEALEAYITALKKGFLKTLARLGISTLRSFRGAQSFEAIGLGPALVERCFTGTASRLGGIGFAELAAETLTRVGQAYSGVPKAPIRARATHLWTPVTVKALHAAVRENNPEERDKAWERYRILSETHEPVTLRDLLTFKNGRPLPLEAVEPAEDIVRRFVGAAMSFGSLGIEAHETLAVALNRLGARSNCGEGGEDPARNRPGRDARGNVADTRSRIRQIASGRFGVTAEYLAFADEIQIKAAQGAKPGEGGQLPAAKVTPEIARVRHTLPGISLISPPPHHDIYSIEDLAQLIYDLRRVQPTARISVKLVAQAGVGTVAVGCVKSGADIVVISGHDGGTGAAPMSAVRHVGLPWEMGLAEARRALEICGLRGGVVLQTDGLLHTGRDLAVAALLGADEFAFGTGLLVALGCVMCRRCHLGTCKAGIATQDAALRRRFSGTPEMVQRRLRFLAGDLRRHMTELGFSTVQDMIGRADMLDIRREDLSPKAATLDLRPLLAVASQPGSAQDAENAARAEAIHPDSGPTRLESEISSAALPVLRGLTARCIYEGRVRNTDRAVGARLSGEIARRAADGKTLPDHAIRLLLTGSAGQSLGAFITNGITIELRGDANDYAGKGLSGGILIVAPGDDEREETQGMLPGRVAVGNVALYGATAGRAYIGGTAGERFAVRNSGATAVVEGMGDHGCEYMTGGVVVVIGPVGCNFGAGMSGGAAFVYDVDERFQNRCNTDAVDLESVRLPEDEQLLRDLLEQHLRHTGSARAASLLANWEAALPLFVKVVPLEHETALQRLRESERNDPDTVAGTEEIFPRRRSRA